MHGVKLRSEQGPENRGVALCAENDENPPPGHRMLRRLNRILASSLTLSRPTLSPLTTTTNTTARPTHLSPIKSHQNSMSSSKLILALLALPATAYRTSARPRLRGGVSETTSDVPKSASPAFDEEESRRLGAAIRTTRTTWAATRAPCTTKTTRRTTTAAATRSTCPRYSASQ